MLVRSSLWPGWWSSLSRTRVSLRFSLAEVLNIGHNNYIMWYQLYLQFGRWHSHVSVFKCNFAHFSRHHSPFSRWMRQLLPPRGASGRHAPGLATEFLRYTGGARHARLDGPPCRWWSTPQKPGWGAEWKPLCLRAQLHRAWPPGERFCISFFWLSRRWKFDERIWTLDIACDIIFIIYWLFLTIAYSRIFHDFFWLEAFSFHLVPLWGLLEAWEGKAQRSKAGPEQNFHHEMLKKLALHLAAQPGLVKSMDSQEFYGRRSFWWEEMSTTNRPWDDQHSPIMNDGSPASFLRMRRFPDAGEFVGLFGRHRQKV